MLGLKLIYVSKRGPSWPVTLDGLDWKKLSNLILNDICRSIFEYVRISAPLSTADGESMCYYNDDRVIEYVSGDNRNSSTAYIIQNKLLVWVVFDQTMEGGN